MSRKTNGDMTIDKEQLISLLIDKTGLEREKVEYQLQELISRIQQAAEEGKSFEVEGLGTFQMQEGDLQFEPTDILETEINNKYAGMKPIELIGAFKEPDGEEIPDMDDQQDDQDKVWAFDGDAVERKEPAEEPLMETSDAEDEMDEKPEQEADEDVESETQEHEQPDEDVEEQLAEVNEEDDRVAEEPKETETEIEEPVKVAAEEETDDPIGRFLVAAIVVIAIGLGGWFVYDVGLSSTSERSSQASNPAQQSSNIPAQQTRDTQNEQTPSNQSSEQNQPEDQVNSEPEEELEVTTQEGTDAEQATYGLRGTLNNNIESGYTIVVHSLRVEQKAENRRQNLQQAGFRALVNQAMVEGTTYYRVGIGQFETVESAQQAIPDIPEAFQDNNFIKRIK